MYKNEKPYYTLDTYLKETYGEKIYKITLDPGFTCPNRDGTLSQRGCIFCSEGGSGEFSSSNIEDGIRKVSDKFTGQHYIAYFQAYTNTYGPVSKLKELYQAALDHPLIIGISIATRPDCLGTEVLHLLEALKLHYPTKFIWVELGLQTIKEQTAIYIRRGYTLACFEEAVKNLHRIQIPIIVHIILGLPGETKTDYIKTMHYLNQLPLQGLKLHLLHILKNTDLAEDYLATPFPIYSLEEYSLLIIELLEHVRKDMVIHRITGDGPKDLLIAPLWSTNKKKVLNHIHKEMKEMQFFQGKQLS